MSEFLHEKWIHEMVDMAVERLLSFAHKRAARNGMKSEQFCRVDYDPMHTVIHHTAFVGHLTRVGLFTVIEQYAKIGANCTIGHHVQIGPDVVIGEHVKIGNGVTLKPGTRIGDHSIVDDHCITTGPCWIGNNVNVRTGAIISKATAIEDWVFVGPAVVTNHTKHVDYGRPQVKSKPLLTVIGTGSIIGSRVAMVAGVDIAPLTILGAGSLVIKDIDEPAVYAGNPLRRLQELPLEYVIDGSSTMLDEAAEHFEKWLPEMDVSRLRGVTA